MTATASGTATENQAATSPQSWAHALLLTCKLTVDLPLPGFTVADMLRLHSGDVIPTHWRVGEDVPLQVNGRPLATGEFEIAGTQLAMRLTELV